MKNSIGNYLLVGCVFFILGFLASYYSKTESNFYGEVQPIISTQVEHNKIDSIEVHIIRIDSSIAKIRTNKIKLSKKKDEEISYIDNLEYDSLYRIFSNYYPREREDSI